MVGSSNIRNFSIIAHIDHGKSTLADRLLEITETVSPREMREQVLDRMDLERERGITIKAQAVRMLYTAKDGKKYTLNLIDTPGHVDFTYEVSRSLAACEGAILVVDSAQGVEAQTVANAILAEENGLKIIPVINKIDLPNADPKRIKKELVEIGLDTAHTLLTSGKTGEGVREMLEAIIDMIPAPSGSSVNPLQALIFDSFFDSYRGVVVFVRIVGGVVKRGMKIKMMASSRHTEVEEVGIFTPEMKSTSELRAGEVGYLITGVKETQEIKVGDTLTSVDFPTASPLTGYKEVKPMVFCGIYPLEGGEYQNLRVAFEKLKLNDPSFTYEPEKSLALGFGFRVGFLGLLHMEIVKERLEREFGLELLVTDPTVPYEITKPDGEKMIVRSPLEFPEPREVRGIKEPVVEAVILTPPSYLGQIFELFEEHEGEFKNMQYLSENRVQLEFQLPLREILWGFYDDLKGRTRGYASLDYHLGDYKESPLAKLEILLAGQSVDALSVIVPKSKAYTRGRKLVERLRSVIPRQLFEVPIQAKVEGKIIARETIKPLRKDVTAKLYGGDVTRKRKLLEKQKAGKKKMKKMGKVEIPQEAFLTLLKIDEK